MEVPELEFEPTMPNFIRLAAERFGDTDFIVMPDRRLSYAQADAASQRVARELLARGVGKGTRVGIHFSYGTEWVIAFFAVTRIGAVALPMSTVYRPVELRKAAKHGDVDTLIVPSHLVGADHLAFVEQAFPLLAETTSPQLFMDEVPYLRSILVSGGSTPAWAESIDLGIDSDSTPPLSAAFLEAAEAQVAPADWMTIVHTSGTTGDPKGVVHAHGPFVRHSENLSTFMGDTPAKTQFAGMPWFWIGGLVCSIGQSMSKGFKLLCLEKFDNAAALDLIIEERPLQIGMWGQLGQRFGQYVASTGRDVSNVPALAPRPGMPTDITRYHNSLGQTESLGPHSAGGPEYGQVIPEEVAGSFGLPVPHVEHRIIDSETGEDMPPGVEGEIIVRGYSLSQGLYKKERNEAFDDDGWLHTGDRGYFREGYLFFTGRFTEMIKTLGSNVAPREVELVLAEIPEVGLPIVFGVDDDDRGQIVAAVIVPKPGMTVDLEALAAHASDQLSSYKVPRHYMVLPSEDLPSLGSGKPDKIALMAMLTKDIEASRAPAS